MNYFVRRESGKHSDVKTGINARTTVTLILIIKQSTYSLTHSLTHTHTHQGIAAWQAAKTL